MTELVMDGEKVFASNLDAHLEAQVVEVVDIPGAGVADHIAVARLEKKRALPESLRQRIETQVDEEAFAVLHHLLPIGVAFLEQLGDIEAGVGVGGRHQRVNIRPVLCPHIAQQVGWNRAGGGNRVDRKSTRLNSSHLGISYAV